MSDAAIPAVFAAIEGVALSAVAPLGLTLFALAGCALTVLLANLVASLGSR